MSQCDFFVSFVVDRSGKSLGKAAAVDKDHRRTVRPDQLDQARVNRRPDGGDARLQIPLASFAGLFLRLCLSELRHVFDRDFDGDVELSFPAGFNNRHVSRSDGRIVVRIADCRFKVLAAEQSGNFVKGALRG